MMGNAAAIWNGGAEDGSGLVFCDSGVLFNAPYAVATAPGDRAETSPQELLAAAQASAYSMALSRLLSTRNITPERIDTTATVMGRADDVLAITAVHLSVNARLPDADRAELETMAQQAKSACLVSPLFNVEITLETHLDTAPETGAVPMQGTLRLRHRRPRIIAMRS